MNVRIGILTFHWAINYGAILQVTALYHYLRKIDPDSQVDIINFIPKKFERAYSLSIIRRNPKISIERLSYIFNGGHKRSKKFLCFINNNLSLTQKISNLNDLPSILEKYDSLIVGSDQVWNKEIVGEFINAFILKNVCSARKISYSASVGSCQNIPLIEQELRYVAKNFDFISVREKCLEEYFKHIINRDDVVLTLDPVFLHDEDFWAGISQNMLCDKTNNQTEKYILVYMLDYDPKLIDFVRFISDITKMPVISIEPPLYRKHKYRNKFADKYIYDLGPEEFLSFFRHSSLVVTNSFHGTAFSIIFGRPFFVIPHPTRNDRIISLLRLLNLEEYMVTKADTDTIKNQIKRYSSSLNHAKSVLKILQTNSRNFLRRSLKEGTD